MRELGPLGCEDVACRNVELGGRLLRALDQEDWSYISIDDLTYTRRILAFLECWLKHIVDCCEVLEGCSGHATYDSSHGNITLVGLEARRQAEGSLDGGWYEVRNVLDKDSRP